MKSEGRRQFLTASLGTAAAVAEFMKRKGREPWVIPDEV